MENWLMLFAVVAVVAVIAVQMARRNAASRQTTLPQTSMPQTTGNAGATPMDEKFPMPPQNIASANGLNLVPPYVHQLMQAQKQAAVLMISTLDGQDSLSLMRVNGQTRFNLPTERFDTPQKLQVVQTCFARLGIAAEHNQSGNAHLLSYVVPENEAVVANATKTALMEIFHVRGNDGLKFTFEERDF